jgi:mRNA-degrading endonuclease toxin of MazEF toxin-antitoxin module
VKAGFFAGMWWCAFWRERLFRLPVSPSQASGLRQESEVMVDKISAIVSSRVTKRIGCLSPSQIKHLDQALRMWLELPSTIQ